MTSRRATQAEQTRRDILAAARGQFAEVGYAATTMRGVASAAGVSVQTVYDSVGSKADLVRGLNDLIDEEAGIDEVVGAAMGSGEPVRIAGLPAAVSRRLLDRCGDIIRVVLDGRRHEAELAAVAAEGHRRHLIGVEQVIDRLTGLDALRPGLGRAEAITTVAAVADFRLALVLMDEYAMTAAAVEQWAVDTTMRAVLATG